VVASSGGLAAASELDVEADEEGVVSH
jgi:hypothetical protein